MYVFILLYFSVGIPLTHITTICFFVSLFQRYDHAMPRFILPIKTLVPVPCSLYWTDGGRIESALVTDTVDRGVHFSNPSETLNDVTVYEVWLLYIWALLPDAQSRQWRHSV